MRKPGANVSFSPRARLAMRGGRTYLQRMHELSLAESIVEIVTERTDAARVRRIRVEVGRSLAVVPEALRFCFEVVSRGSPLEEATLEVDEIPVSGWCAACDWEGILDGPVPLCPRCTGAMEIRSGMELRIREVEVV